MAVTLVLFSSVGSIQSVDRPVSISYLVTTVYVTLVVSSTGKGTLRSDGPELFWIPRKKLPGAAVPRVVTFVALAMMRARKLLLSSPVIWPK